MPTITLTLSSDRLESLTDIVSLTCARCVRDGSISVHVGLLDDSDDLDSVLVSASTYVPYVAPEPVAKPTITDRQLKARWFDVDAWTRGQALLKHVCTTCRAAAGMPCQTAGGADYAMGMGHASRARLAARMYFGIKS